MSVEVHRRLLIAGYLILGIYAGVQLLTSYQETLGTQLAFFDHDRLYAYLSFSVIALVPASCFFIAIALQKEYHGTLLVLPVIHTAVVLVLYGVILALYLSGWYFARTRASAP